MREELAGRLLDQLFDWSDEERTESVAALARLAQFKFDHYEGFSAGERFFERLARWLVQFEGEADRRRLLEFVRSELVFISRDEMNQAISCAYPHHIRQLLIAQTAQVLNLPEHMLAQITSSAEFRAIRRATLFLGLSDGARLDLLRRSSSELSHEQFSLSPELGEGAQKSMQEKLVEALASQQSEGSPYFQNIVLVDDFYGSGTSLIDQREDGSWKGKLERVRTHIRNLANSDRQVVSGEPRVSVVLYIASRQARQHIEQMLGNFEPDWNLIVVQELPATLKVTDDDLRRICTWFFDPVMDDQHKGSAAHGYRDAALPVVLFHNTPNNSISVLWADTEQQVGSRNRLALFPRYERHHADRP